VDEVPVTLPPGRARLASSDRIARRKHHDRDVARRLFRDHDSRRRVGHDCVDLQTDELRGKTGKQGRIAVRHTSLKAQVLALAIAELAQSIAKKRPQRLGIGKIEDADRRGFCPLRRRR
jgi:hypothetical protein